MRLQRTQPWLHSGRNSSPRRFHTSYFYRLGEHSLIFHSYQKPLRTTKKNAQSQNGMPSHAPRRIVIKLSSCVLYVRLASSASSCVLFASVGMEDGVLKACLHAVHETRAVLKHSFSCCQMQTRQIFEDGIMLSSVLADLSIYTYLVIWTLMMPPFVGHWKTQRWNSQPHGHNLKTTWMM